MTSSWLLTSKILEKVFAILRMSRILPIKRKFDGPYAVA